MNVNLTNGGLSVMLRGLAGGRILFTRISLGNGEPQAALEATQLANPIVDMEISELKVEAKYASISATFSNTDVSAGFRCTEIGVFVQHPDSEDEILYAYGTIPEAEADYISANDDRIQETKMNLMIFVDSAENVSAMINESLVFATKKEFSDHVNDTNNPHKVTKDDVGLGNVQNELFGDNTLEFTEPLKLEKPVSGSKLAAIIAQAVNGIGQLINHLSNKNNPHGVTAAQVKAAASDHKHTATDINGGTLGVARGGTGLSQLIANRIMYPSSTTAFTSMAFPTGDGQVLHQNKTGAPRWDYASAAETGSYTGGGKSGVNAQNSITFKRGIPKIVIIMESRMNRIAFLMPHAGRGYTIIDGADNRVTVSVSENTVSWYFDSSTSHPANQMDTSGSTFYYVGIA